MSSLSWLQVSRETLFISRMLTPLVLHSERFPILPAAELISSRFISSSIHKHPFHMGSIVKAHGFPLSGPKWNGHGPFFMWQCPILNSLTKKQYFTFSWPSQIRTMELMQQARGPDPGRMRWRGMVNTKIELSMAFVRILWLASLSVNSYAVHSLIAHTTTFVLLTKSRSFQFRELTSNFWRLKSKT
jgi:hypothetical protein